ncbi:hypothetical protein KCU64_g8, partial [Aureobasidium melanogenum]
MSNEQLAREHEQLVREQGLLGMPFLNEELPFLAEFDGYPEVSVEEVLDVLEVDNTTTIAVETASAAEHDVGAFNAPEVSFEELIGDYDVVECRADENSTSTAAETAPDMDMFDAPEVSADELFAPNIAPGAHASASSSAATSATTAAPDAGGFKKSCKICATRKVKCEIIPGHNPRLCRYCQEKGLACEFELKKNAEDAAWKNTLEMTLKSSNPIMRLAKRLISIPPLLTRAPKPPLSPLPQHNLPQRNLGQLDSIHTEPRHLIHPHIIAMKTLEPFLHNRIQATRLIKVRIVDRWHDRGLHRMAWQWFGLNRTCG